MKNILALSVLILVLAYCRGEEDIEIRKQQILDDLLNPKKYDKRVRPSGSDDSPTEVVVSAYILNIPHMDDDLKEYTMQGYFRMSWVDERLEFPEEEKIRKIRCAEPEKLWKPDLFFSNEIDAKFHDVVVPNKLMRLTPKGNLLYSVRISMILSCDSDMKYYPHDQQKCTTKLESYEYPSSELRLRWNPNSPVGFHEKLSTRHKFHLLDHEETSFTTVFNETTYETLAIEILFSRNFNIFLQAVYIPSILLVVLSWGSFCLDPTQFAPRFSLLGLVIFFMVQLVPEPESNFLQVTAMDVWIGTCMAFLLAAFVVLLVVGQEITREEADRSASEQSAIRDAESGNMKEETPNDKDSKNAKGNKYIQEFMKKHPTRSKRIDAVCRIVFPILFLLFNIIYWPVCYSNYESTLEDWNADAMK